MDIFVRMIEDQLCIVHFSLSYKEAKATYNKVKYENPDDDFDYIFKEMIENELLDDELEKIHISPCGYKKITYLSYLEKNRPLIGVATFVKQESLELINLPQRIPTHINDMMKNIDILINEDFYRFLLNNDLYYKNASKTVGLSSIITYDLEYRGKDDGQVFYRLDNQTFDMLNDKDLDPSNLIGKIKGDRVIINNTDIQTEVVIKKITNRDVYTREKNNPDDVLKFGFDSFKQLELAFDSSSMYMYKLDNYISYILDYIIENNNVKISDKVMDFYKETDHPYMTVRNSKGVPLNIQAKKSYVLEQISKSIEHYFFENEEYADDYINAMSVFWLYNALTFDNERFVKCSLDKFMILKYYSRKKIINGILI